MKLNKETLKQTVKKGYVKGKTFVTKAGDKIFEHKNDLAWTGVLCGYVVMTYLRGVRDGTSTGYDNGLHDGYKLGRQDQMSIEDEWFDGMDTETYNTVTEYDKRRHKPILKSNQR